MAAVGASHTTLAQNAGPARGEKSLPMYLPDAPCHFDPATDTTFQTKKQEKARLLKQYPIASGRLSQLLLQVMDAHEKLGKETSLRLAQSAGGNVVENRITVIVQLVAGSDPDDISKKIEAAGGVVVRARSDHIKARVPTSSLRKLAETIPDVFIRLPEKPFLCNTTISQGKGLMNAQTWQNAGFNGAGVKVAVIDKGFIGLAARKASDEIPATAVSVDESGLGMETNTDHGCAVAEILYDMAPNAQLYLIKVLDESDLQDAEVYCKANDIQIVNHSMVWYGYNFFDGQAYSSMTPSPVSIVNDADTNGILWVNCAGNDQHAHALIRWRDGDSDNILDWAGSGVNVNQIGYYSAGSEINVFLVWNSWPTTAQDFDLYLVRWTDSEWTIVTGFGGQDRQMGSEPPNEYVCVASAPYSAYYGVVVVKYSATSSPYFILRSPNGWLQYTGYNTTNAVSGSIGCPADVSNAWAVGAIDWSSYATGPIETYSSLGPNNAVYTGGSALTKPDICGPDATASVTYPTFLRNIGVQSASGGSGGAGEMRLSVLQRLTDTDFFGRACNGHGNSGQGQHIWEGSVGPRDAASAR